MSLSTLLDPPGTWLSNGERWYTSFSGAWRLSFEKHFLKWMFYKVIEKLLFFSCFVRLINILCWSSQVFRAVTGYAKYPYPAVIFEFCHFCSHPVSQLSIMFLDASFIIILMKACFQRVSPDWFATSALHKAGERQIECLSFNVVTFACYHRGLALNPALWPRQVFFPLGMWSAVKENPFSLTSLEYGWS